MGTCMFTHIHKCVDTHVHTRTLTHSHTHTCTHAHTHTRTHAHTHTRTHTHTLSHIKALTQTDLSQWHILHIHISCEAAESKESKRLQFEAKFSLLMRPKVNKNRGLSFLSCSRFFLSSIWTQGLTPNVPKGHKKQRSFVVFPSIFPLEFFVCSNLQPKFHS